MTKDIKSNIATLTAEQRRLILQKMQKKQGDGLQDQILPKKRETNIFPLSFAQQRLWFLEQMEPGNTTYLLLLIQRFLDDLNIEALEHSLEQLIQRHEALRTTFQVQDGQPVQIIHMACLQAFPLIDLQGLQQELRNKEAQQLISQERQHPCDLVQGPLLRRSIVRIAKQEHIVLLTVHHIITDKWSNEILVRELFELYQGHLVESLSPLPPLKIQYGDYALWQRQWLQGEVLERQQAYWLKQLAGGSSLELPTDRPRPSVQTYKGATQTLLVPAVVLTQLQALSQQEGVTMFMLLLTAFQVLLQRYTGQSDISVGTPIANRTRAEIEGVIGFFVNTLVIRGDLSGNPPFQQLLKKMREVCLQAYAHQDIPFEKVVGELEVVRDMSRTPLFQVMFVLQNALREQGKLQVGANVEPLVVESTHSKFDLTLTLSETGQGLYCSLEYNTDLFIAETITRLLNHWQVLLQALVQIPTACIAELPLLTEDERECLLSRWNATQAAYPEHLCLHNLFEQQVAKTPDAIAVESGQEQLTYKQLDWRANQLASYLHSLGVGPEVLIGISLKPSVELVTGILGILKAGGVYVPLDITSPKQRLVSIVEGAGITILLTNGSLQENLPMVEQVVDLDNDWTAIAQYNGEEPPDSTILPTNLAYVIYTSGSTGQPKGVMVSHQGVVHYVDWSSRHYAVAAGFGSPVHSPLSFDLTITSLFPPLIVGRRLVMVPDAPGIEMLCQALLLKNEFSLLKITPAHLNLLSQSLQPEELAASARALIIGGEALHSESISAWRKHAPTTRLVNEYGPTEAVVGCCIYEISQDEELAGIVPIGRPIPNTQIYLLDAQLQLVPIGVPGELYIGGVGLGRGYLNRPDLTAERFIANPFGNEPGTRLYKTGDIARYISTDGILEYLGRVDNQVKLRGYRIELAEIEAVLRQHPQVADCAVLLQEDGPASPRLVAYVVVQSASVLTPESLGEMLRKHIPAYMVPSIFTILDALPLTPNGKVDRRQLLALEHIHSSIVAPSDPRGPIEDVLLNMWKELLVVPLLGIHDNFFAVGGHSLLATRLIAQIRAVLQVELPVRTVFDAPTVAGLAQQVELALGKNAGQMLPPLVPAENCKDLPLSFAQQRLWFLDQLHPGNSAYLVPRVKHFLGPLDVQALEKSLEELVHRHASLRTTFAVRSDQPIQIIHSAGRYSLPLIDLCGLSGEQKKAEAWSLSRLEARRPCDLERGPLLRTHIVRFANEEHVLLMTLHHIITDGWSNEIVVSELTMLYEAYVTRQPSPLPPLAIQYADYAVWQRQWLQGKVLEAQLDYWTRQLGGARPIELPSDDSPSSLSGSRGAAHTFVLSADLSQRLIAFSRQEGVTLFMTLLAAFHVLFYRYTGQTDIVIGTDSTNRNQLETERIVGFFVNLLALRVDLSGRPSFRKVLKRVQGVVIAAYTHCDTPFELLVEKLAPEHHREHLPLVQVLFVLENMLMETQKIAEVGAPIEDKTIEPPQSHPTVDQETVVKFDLALFMQEHAGKLSGTLNYRLDLFKASTIETMMARFATVLQNSVSQPDVSIDLLDYISESEQEQKKQEEQKKRKGLPIRNDGWQNLPAINFSKNK